MTLQYESNLTLPEKLKNCEERLLILEQRFNELGYDVKNIVTSEVHRTWRIMPQSISMYGMMTALCVSTIDPWKQNRVQFYSPLLSDPDTAVQDLPYAFPISTMGGIDDCGLNWVPPAGSMLCLTFEQGARWSPYYIGTTWSRDRGPAGAHNWNYPMPEYDRVYSGHRKGYLLAPDDESQVLPQWNTESYNGKDINNIGQFESDTDAQKKITTPNIYGFKTPEKHMIKMVDGDPKCGRRWKRMEIMSGGGSGWILIKDDPIHPVGQWANPDCGIGGGDVSDCSINPDKDCENPADKPKGANPYFKHKNECWPYRGPGTPQNNKADLDQTGMQFLTKSGQSISMKDDVDEPRGNSEWERSLDSFDYGCNDVFKGSIAIHSSTGQKITASDTESDTNIRDDKNGVFIRTACGNEISANDHTVKGSGDDTSKRAGRERGIKLQSTSLGLIQICDWDNEQSSPDRRDGGVPVNKAKKAYILIRTGYGLQMMFADRASQEETQTQFINILSPQKDNTERGAHMIHMQEAKEGPGLVFIRAGGNLILNSYDSMVDIVGTETNPANKISIVTNKYVVNTADIHYHYSGKSHVLQSEDYIFLLAGRDCDEIIDDGNGNIQVNEKSVPCAYRVVIDRNPMKCPVVDWMCHYTTERSTSERVLASGFSPIDSYIPEGVCTCCPPPPEDEQ